MKLKVKVVMTFTVLILHNTEVRQKPWAHQKKKKNSSFRRQLSLKDYKSMQFL